MPLYDYELADGRIATLESDHEPSEDEVLSLTANLPPKAKAEPLGLPPALITPEMGGQPIPPEQIQADMDKMARNERMSQLREQLGYPEQEPRATARTGFREELAERFDSYARGLSGLVPAAMKTVANVLPRLTEPGPVTDPLLPSFLRPLLEVPELYQAGKSTERFLQEEAFPPPVVPDLGHQVMEGFGQAGPMLGTGAAVRLAGGGLGAATAAASTLGGIQEFDDAFERATARGDDKDTAFAKSLGYATVAGLIENKLGAGRLLRQLFPNAGDAVKRLTALGVSKRLLGNFVAGGLEEGTQRAAQNWIVEEKPSMEGVTEEALPGAIVQSVLGLPGVGVTEPSTERTPDAIQQETAGVLPPLREPEVSPEGQVQVPVSPRQPETAEALAPVDEFAGGTRTVVHGGTGRFAEGQPVWFTGNRVDAEWFAGERGGESPRLVEAEVTINRPARQSDVEAAAKAVDATPADVKSNSSYSGENPLDYVYVPKVVSELKRRGFDGLIDSDVLENTSIMAYVPFDKTQIKIKSTLRGTRNKDTGDFVFAPEGSPQAAEALTPEVSSFIAEYDKTEGPIKVTNRSSDPTMVTTDAVGKAVKTVADLDALLAVNNRVRGRVRELMDKKKKEGKLTEAEQSEFYRLAGVSQFPREVVERATNVGSGSDKVERPWEEKFTRTLDWKNNPEVADWLIAHGEELTTDVSEVVEARKAAPQEPQRAAAFFPRQSEALGLGEPALPPTVETVRQQRAQEAGQTPSPITPAPGEKTTPTRGTFFEGNNPRETSRMMQQRADDFLAGKTDEQAVTALASLGVDPAVNLDNQAANFVIKDLLVKFHRLITATDNPIEQQRLWSNIDRLAEISRRLGAEDARSLVSRNLAYKQIDWLMPLLAWRGIVRDQWRKALGVPEGQPLDESKITAEASNRLGLPLPNGEQTKKIAKLSKEASELPQGVRRNKALEEMVREIQKVAPISKSQLLSDIWYSSVLMRVGTMVNVLAGSYATGASFAGLAALDRLVRLHPIQAMKIIGQFIGGTIEGTLIADQIARKGAYHLLPDAEQRMVNLLTGKAGARYDNLEELLRRGNPVGVLAYTRRFMAALDYIGALGTRDSQVMYGALTRGDQESLDALDKRFDRDLNKKAEAQAKAEIGPKASRAEVLVRKREILEQGVSEELKQQSVQTSRRAAQNADPRGLPGLIYKGVSKLPFWVKAPAGLAFIRSAMNMVQNAADYMPGIGAFGAMRGYFGSLPDKHPLKKFGFDMPIEERRMAWAAQASSLGIAAAAAAMFLGDDDDEGWEISGSWRGLTPAQKGQLMEQGERPNSIRVGKNGPWISFKQMPFAPPLAIIGTMRDEERFHAKDWEGEAAGNKLVSAWLGGLLYVRDISSLSGIAGMFDKNAWSTQESPSKMDDKLNKLAAQSVGRAASGYIPSVIKELDEFTDPTLYRPSKDEMAGWWIRNIPFARKTVGPGPALNNFGEPIQTTPPPLKSWVGFGKDNDLYNTLGELASRGIFMPEPGRTAKIVDDNAVYRDMTEDEWYQFIKTRGPMLKESVSTRLQWLRESDPRDVTKWLSDESERIGIQARHQLWPMTTIQRLRRELPTAAGTPR